MEASDVCEIRTSCVGSPLACRDPLPLRGAGSLHARSLPPHSVRISHTSLASIKYYYISMFLTFRIDRLLSLRDMDGLPLGIIEAVHGVDAREHAESVAANDGEEELK